MPKDKRSFFERLTGTVNAREFETDDEEPISREVPSRQRGGGMASTANSDEGELTVDVFQTPNDIFIKTIVAGVRPDDLDISITRDMVTIRGSRQESHEVNDGDYFHRELYWGTFSRTILLPQEIDVDASEASE